MRDQVVAITMAVRDYYVCVCIGRGETNGLMKRILYRRNGRFLDTKIIFSYHISKYALN